MQLQTINIGEIKPTKFGIDLLASSIAEDVNEGKVNALDAAIQISALENFIKSLKEKIGEQVMNELSKHPKSKAELNGVLVTEFNSIKYDYSGNNDWTELEEQIKQLNAKKKEVEDFEKSYYKGNLAIKSSVTTYKITLPK